MSKSALHPVGKPVVGRDKFCRSLTGNRGFTYASTRADAPRLPRQFEQRRQINDPVRLPSGHIRDRLPLAVDFGCRGSLRQTRRVLRGGSWNNDRDNARAAYRNPNHPGNRNNNIGMRLVCLSHVLGPPSTGPASAEASGLTGLADPGSASGIGVRLRLGARGEGSKMAQVHPARAESLRTPPDA